MKQLFTYSVLLLLLFSAESAQAQAFNPFTQNIEFTPEPPNTGFDCEYRSQLVFTIGMTTKTDAHLDPNDPLQVYICLTGFQFDGNTPASILSGTYVSNFTWAFDPISPNCLIGTQFGSLPGTGNNPLNPDPNSVGTIIVDVIVSDISPAGSILVGDVTLEIPAYMNASNTVADDNELTQTQTSAVCPINISGNVFHDQDEDDNNKVDGFGINNICSTPLYVHLIDPNGNVDDVQAVSNDGSFDFVDAELETSYKLVLSTVQAPINGPEPSPSIPCFWNFVGDDCCDDNGNDGNHDGSLLISIDSNRTFNANFGVNSPALALPVELSEFEVSIFDCQVHLNWATAFQFNLDYTEIERKVEGELEFQSIHKIESSINTSESIEHTYIDHALKLDEQVEYRLKFVDIDGSFFISEVKSLKNVCKRLAQGARIFPNPTSGSLKINYAGTDDLIQYAIIDVQGRSVLSNSLIHTTNSIDLDLGNLNPGQYVLIFKDLEKGTVWNEKFILLEAR